MRAGNSSANTWSSIVKSGWVTGKVDPKRTSYAAGGGTSGNSASSTSSDASSGAWAAAIAAGQTGFNGGNGGDINYGGFTLNINGITDPNKVASAVKAILQNPAATIGKK